MFWMADSCVTVLFTLLRVIAIFEKKTISQGSVATRLRCGVIFNYFVARNLLLSLSVKELWKSAFGIKLQTKVVQFFPDTMYKENKG